MRQSYSVAIISEGHKTKVSSPHNSEKIVGTIHSHGNYDGIITDKQGKKYEAKNNEFSNADKNNNATLKVFGYLATPNGSLLEHNPTTEKISTISTELPSDPNDPTRMNKIDPVDMTKSESVIIKFFDLLKKLFE